MTAKDDLPHMIIFITTMNMDDLIISLITWRYLKYNTCIKC